MTSRFDVPMKTAKRRFHVATLNNTQQRTVQTGGSSVQIQRVGKWSNARTLFPISASTFLISNVTVALSLSLGVANGSNIRTKSVRQQASNVISATNESLSKTIWLVEMPTFAKRQLYRYVLVLSLAAWTISQTPQSKTTPPSAL